jgi:hypothetical protein
MADSIMFWVLTVAGLTLSLWSIFNRVDELAVYGIALGLHGIAHLINRGSTQ